MTIALREGTLENRVQCLALPTQVEEAELPFRGRCWTQEL